MSVKPVSKLIQTALHLFNVRILANVLRQSICVDQIQFLPAPLSEPINLALHYKLTLIKIPHVLMLVPL